VPRPWRHPSAAELAQRPLILKSPSDAYRLRFWREVFPNARFRILHLTRSPAAAINGLYDGWRHDRGFHSHYLGERQLRIRGYTTTPLVGADAWWKFDLPPGWTDYARAPLEQVCGFQWLSAHTHVLRSADEMNLGEDYVRVAFEDLVGAPETRVRVLAGVLRWLGADAETAIPDARVVMATHPPSRDRWRKREAILRPILQSPAIRRVADELGYRGADSW